MERRRTSVIIRLYFLSLWSFIDPIYFAFTRLQYLHSKQHFSIFRVRLTKYKGRNVTLSDGTQIKKNDLLVKIHLHNVRLYKEVMFQSNSISRGKTIYRMVQQSFPSLADYVQHHPKQEKIKGVIGITMINKGIKKLGFETAEPKNHYYIWLKKLTQIPIYFLFASDLKVNHVKRQKPTYLFMSKSQLMKKYRQNHPSTISH